MLNGEIRSKIDALWNAFWTGGISTPFEVVEQITDLLFIKRLDDLHTVEENKAARLKLKKLERRVFPEGKDPNSRAYEDCRWSRFKHFAAKELFEVVDQHVFPFLRILGKIASAGQNGQFRTPRHIIQLMVEIVRPVPTDIMCDPASGTCGFPVAVGEYLRRHHPEILRDARLKEHFQHHLFHGFDFDNTMLLHGVENSDIRYRDSHKEVILVEVTHRPPGEILQSLGALESEITTAMKELKGLLK